nr:RNA-directed DNA polymerase, eukaryota, nucleotide-binding alpha-beta plait domain protein [Tanacetum cinerariifolium]
MTSVHQRRLYAFNEDHIKKISHSIYVTNFPDSASSRDLWRACNTYGTVVDVYIPLKKSQTGKRFAFVRFIKVFNLDRLVKNFCTIWIGHHHLYANQVRFERPHKPVFSFSTERDFSKYAMGRVKDVYSISNIMSILQDEDFVDEKPKYLGGFWVLFEFEKEETKANMLNHMGVNSWFQVIQDVPQDFVSDERIAWVDIEGTVLSEEEEGEFNYSKVEGVPETIFEVNSISDQGHIREPDKQISKDPFGIYNILHKNQPHGEIKAPSSSLSHPPGFTPVDLAAKTGNVHSNEEVHMEVPKGSIGQSVDTKGGSVLGVLEEVIRVGQAMGFSMEGCEKDIEAIIGNQGDDVPADKRDLWEYLSILIGRWKGETILMGDFNEVRSREERRGSVFNPSGARVFNHFIDSLGLVDVKLEGYSFTWSHPSATKMSKLD